MISLQDAKYNLKIRSSFNAGNLTANVESGEKNGEEVPVYVVRSYGVAIAKCSPFANVDVWITDTKYSQTTSKHTNLVKKAWAN